MSEEEEILDNAVIEEDTGVDVNTQTDTPPAYGSERWHEYVMRQFMDDELLDGNPTCDGCRRVVELLVGPIMESHILEVHPPTSTNFGTATVVVGLTIYVDNQTHPLCGCNVVIQEVADVNKENTDQPYHRYPSATAATRAEGRALRKLLRLRNVVAEEVSKAATEESETEWVPDEPITDNQINVIDMMAARMDINVMDFVNSGRRVYQNINEVRHTTAQRMIQELNRIQQQKKSKPGCVGKYNPNWRSN